MKTLLKNGTVYLDHEFRKADLLLSEDGIDVYASDNAASAESAADCSFDAADHVIVPGFADVHVHFREPGFSYKETIRTGSLAGAYGGYTCVCTMPNLNPKPSTPEGLKAQTDIIRRDSVIHTIPYGAITRKQDGRSELSDMKALAPQVCAFTDDGKGVQTEERMREAMETAHALGKIITAHCEDESLLGGSAIHDGRFAKSIGWKGISSESEWKQIERDCRLAEETGCAYHVCHVSTRESIQVIRDAKKSGVDVTCETGPHYLVLSEEDLFHIDPDDPASGRFKMNPPLRSEADRKAMLEAVIDGTVDMIATDHAPHSAEEKAKGLLKSANGIVGLESAFPVLYTRLVLPGILTMDRLIELMCTAPRRRFGLPGIPPETSGAQRTADGALHLTGSADVTVLDLETPYTIRAEEFRSMGHSCPFDGWEVRGKAVMTFCGGQIAADRGELKKRK